MRIEPARQSHRVKNTTRHTISAASAAHQIAGVPTPTMSRAHRSAPQSWSGVLPPTPSGTGEVDVSYDENSNCVGRPR
jgi:hypothetical protein